MSQEAVQNNIQETLRDRTPQFIASVAALVNSNPEIAKCEQKSILSSCLEAAALDLPINNSMGLAYIVPYNNTIKVKETNAKGREITVSRKVKQAQFQIGWKGFVQLALRTKRYRHINVTDVKEGEYLGTDRMTGEDKFNWVEDENEREKLETVGYLAYFELLEGFSKTKYMTVEKINKHAHRYSKALKAGFGNWKDDFESMAMKTVLKLLLDKFGPKNTDLQRAIQADQAVVSEDGEYQYPDNQPLDADEIAERKEKERILKHIKNAKTPDDLIACEDYVDDHDEEVREAFDAKQAELEKSDIDLDELDEAITKNNKKGSK